MSRRDDDRDDRDRPSWREIDRKKDASHHIDTTDPYKKSKRGARTEGRSKSYKSALDNFFDGGALPERFQKLSNTREKLAKGPGSKRQATLKKLRDAISSREIEEAVEELLEMDGELPRDPDALIAVLGHPEEDVQRDAIRLLEKLHQERPLKRKDLVKQRLRRIEDLSEDSETIELAASLNKKL